MELGMELITRTNFVFSNVIDEKWILIQSVGLQLEPMN